MYSNLNSKLKRVRVRHNVQGYQLVHCTKEVYCIVCIALPHLCGIVNGNVQLNIEPGLTPSCSDATLQVGSYEAAIHSIFSLLSSIPDLQ